VVFNDFQIADSGMPSSATPPTLGPAASLPAMKLKHPPTQGSVNLAEIEKVIVLKIIKASVISGVLALAACGGGGTGSTVPMPPAPGAQGLWNGSTNTSRSMMSIVLDDGSYWVLYSVPHVSALMAGFVQGTATSLNGSFSSSDAMDFNFEGQGINSGTLLANYVIKQTFNGTLSYLNPNPAFSFTSTYNADYDQAPSALAIAGTYTGIASTTSSNELTTIMVSSMGIVAGTGTGGCQFFGTAVPRAKSNLYDLTVVFSGGVCSSGTSAVAGVGYYDASAKSLHLAALNKSRTNALSFAGIKP
jgi:hypothetical protein